MLLAQPSECVGDEIKGAIPTCWLQLAAMAANERLQETFGVVEQARSAPSLDA
jgi:hypothetical protein